VKKTTRKYILVFIRILRNIPVSRKKIHPNILKISNYSLQILKIWIKMSKKIKVVVRNVLKVG
jgi:hypothetical protein